MFRVLVSVLLTTALTGCGSSGSNPFGSFGSINPFGGGSENNVGEDSTGAPKVIVDDSILAPSIASVTPEAALRGLLIKVQAIAPTQGYHSPYLSPLNRGIPDEDGIVSLEFRVTAPEISQGLGPERTRQLIAAVFYNDRDLDEIVGFRIIGQNNMINIRR